MTWPIFLTILLLPLLAFNYFGPRGWLSVIGSLIIAVLIPPTIYVFAWLVFDYVDPWYKLGLLYMEPVAIGVALVVLLAGYVVRRALYKRKK